MTDSDHAISHPQDNQEAVLLREIDAIKSRIAPTESNIKEYAQAISDLDRITPRPLTPEDQARAVLECIAKGERT